MASPIELARRVARGRHRAEQMTSEQALAERERLERERDDSKRAADDGGAEGRRLEEAIVAARRSRAEALREQARGGERADLDRLDTEEAELLRDRERAREATRAAVDSQKVAAAELENLHRDQFAALAEAAEKLTAEAMQRMEALEAPFHEAHRTWMAARREWNRIAKHNDLEPVQHPPLPEPGTVFGYAPPRPPGVRPDGEPEPEADPEPEAGTPRTFEHVDGRRRPVKVGDMLDRELARSEEWREVES